MARKSKTLRTGEGKELSEVRSQLKREKHRPKQKRGMKRMRTRHSGRY